MAYDSTYGDPMTRVALVADAGNYVGPSLARLLAQRGHDLVLGDPDDELVAELTATGTAVEVVTRVRKLDDPDSSARLVDAAMTRFGRLDAAVAASGRIVTGRFLDSTVDQLEEVVRGCLVGPYHFLKAAVAPMVAAGGGQVLLITSAAGARTTPGAPLYSAVRAGATMLGKNVAAEVARHGVQVNVVGTNYMDFPAFRAATGADDPAIRAKIEAQVPMGRLGTMDEFASFCGPFIDGTSGFTTGQFVAYAGGWA